MEAGAEESDVVLADADIPDELPEPEGYDDGSGDQTGPDDEEEPDDPAPWPEQP